MGQALYRKYRSKSLDEIVGQDHIVRTLKQALKQNKISHAYLFTGPRGVGKTSVARIWAHAINDLPYVDDNPHIDIIEIDAASNRRIDEIRDLREKVHIAPTSAKYKVYIIDEVHMLTREAFNALLKTLEEPPQHAVFILATTDAHKLPETIISRTQRFSFKPASPNSTHELLSGIAKSEKIQISDDALRLIAAHASGSFRDSVGLLDQASSQKSKIEAADIRDLIGMPADESVLALLSAKDSLDSATVMRTLNQLYDDGFQATIIAKRLGTLVRDGILSGSQNYEQSLELLKHLLEVPIAHDPERYLEIVLLSFRQPTPNIDAVKPVPAQDEVKSTKPAPVAEPATPPASEPTAKPVEHKHSPPVSSTFDANIWPEVLDRLKSRHNTLYSVVRMAEPEFGDNTVKLSFAFPFHHKRILENSNQQKIADVIEELTGQQVELEPLVDKSAKPFKSLDELPPIQEDTGLKAISNIFGNAELLES